MIKVDSGSVKLSGLDNTPCRSDSHLAWEKLCLRSCVESSLVVFAKIAVAFMESLCSDLPSSAKR